MRRRAWERRGGSGGRRWCAEAWGSFYDRMASTLTLNARRFDGVTQRSFVVMDPAFYPTIPALVSGPQQLRPVYARDRGAAAVSGEPRGGAAARSRVEGVGDMGVEPGHAFVECAEREHAGGGAVPVRRWVDAFADGIGGDQPDSAGGGECEHRARRRRCCLCITRCRSGRTTTRACRRTRTISGRSGARRLMRTCGAGWRWVERSRLPLGVLVSPFVAINSGIPYNLTTGLDPGRTGYPTARPEGVGRNSERGPANANLGLRVSRTLELRRGVERGGFGRAWGVGARRDDQRVEPERAESSELRVSGGELVVAVLRAVSGVGRADRDVARGGADDIQPEGRLTGAGDVLGPR